MVDPLAEVVSLLKPGAPSGKLVSAKGPWRVQRAEWGRPYYCAILEGKSRLVASGQGPVVLEQGDFVLIPSAFAFTASSLAPPARDTVPVRLRSGEFRHGSRTGEPDVRMLVGYCQFGSPDAGLLVPLLPKLVHVRGQRRLTILVDLLRDESSEQRPAREVILAHLLEVLMIEALRSSKTAASPGLLRGLGDARVGAAIRRMHESPKKAWTVPQLAKAAGLSRSTFFERFSRAVGMPPIEYLFGWRMALAKDLLRQKRITVAEVAERVGYSSASTFSVAFTRSVGVPPTRYARQHAEILLAR